MRNNKAKTQHDMCYTPLYVLHTTIRVTHHYTCYTPLYVLHNTICVTHHYTPANTNNVNKTWALLQTTGGKDEPYIVYMRKS